jgi:hypothetical protein
MPAHVAAGSVAKRVDGSSCQVAVSITNRAGDEGEEGLPMLAAGHLGHFVPADARSSRTQHIGALERSMHPALADDSEHASVDETCHVPVEAAGRDVRKLGPKLARGPRSPCTVTPVKPEPVARDDAYLVSTVAGKTLANNGGRKSVRNARGFPDRRRSRLGSSVLVA